jgi:hypothetical protein
MVDLKGVQKITTLQAIESEIIKREHRPYLGMSQLGHSCSRFLYYSFRWCFTETFSPRIIRLFDRGDREEPCIVSTLEKLGIKCYDDQLECSAAYGHCKGHIDGKSIGVLEAPLTEHLNEYKTMADKYFKEVCKIGVEAAKPIYYGQTQLYMNSLGLTRTLFVAVNKNDDSLYIERIHLRKEVGERLEERAKYIILAESPPEKEFKPTWYECKFCGAKDICHKGLTVDSNCRTCIYGDLLQEGRWKCSRCNLILATDQQRLGCSDYHKLDYL